MEAVAIAEHQGAETSGDPLAVRHERLGENATPRSYATNDPSDLPTEIGIFRETLSPSPLQEFPPELARDHEHLAPNDAAQSLNVDASSRPRSRGSLSSHDGVARSLSRLPTVTDLGFQAAESNASLYEVEPDDDNYTLSREQDLDAGDVRSLSGIGAFVGAREGADGDNNNDVVLDSQMDTTLTLADICNELRNAIHNIQGTDLDGKKPKFLPLDALRRIVNDEVIAKLLQDLHPKRSKEEISAMTQEVISSDDRGCSMRRVFAILILIGKPDSITDFIADSVRDNHLPLQFDWDPRTRFYDIRKRKDMHEHNSRILKPLRKTWTTNQVEDFGLKQALVAVPFFDLSNGLASYYHLNYKDLSLPFVQKSNESLGGNGEVCRVEIHPAHHNYRKHPGAPATKNPSFALKQYHPSDPSAYRAEIDALQKFNGSEKGQEHLNRMLLSFQHNDKYYLLFPWAHGNLREHWKKHRRSEMTVDHVEWLLNQCRGLAKALRKIHSSLTWPKPLPAEDSTSRSEKNYGTHGDIKPENVLAFDSDEHNKARLVISDFGLTRINSSVSRSHVPFNASRMCTNTYRPPEYDLQKDEGQSYDMWGLGCLFLEFLCWSLHGHHGSLDAFVDARIKDDEPMKFASEYKEDKFFNLYPARQNDPAIGVSGPSGNGDGHEYTAKLKQSVRKCIETLHQLPTCSALYHQFLDMIEQGLLVPEQEKRWHMDQVCREFDDIARRSSQDGIDYMVKGQPRPTHRVNPSIPQATTGKLKMRHRPDELDVPLASIPSVQGVSSRPTQQAEAVGPQSQPQVIVWAPEDADSNAVLPGNDMPRDIDSRPSTGTQSNESGNEPTRVEDSGATSSSAPARVQETAFQPAAAVMPIMMAAENSNPPQHLHVEDRSHDGRSLHGYEAQQSTSLSDATPKLSTDEKVVAQGVEHVQMPQRRYRFNDLVEALIFRPLRRISCFHVGSNRSVPD